MSRELAERTEDGILVRLLWDSDADAVHVEYFDLRTGDAFSVPVGKDEALEAFNHPHAYRGDPDAAPEPEPDYAWVAAHRDSFWASRHGLGGA